MDKTVNKFKFKGDGIVLNTPVDLAQEFLALGFTTSLIKTHKNSNILAFMTNNKELLSFLENDLDKIEYDSVLWFGYPKGTSKIKTDINRDIIRETVTKYGISAVTAVSIDSTWSALRFRPTERVGK